MEQTSFFSNAGTSIMPTQEEIQTISGIDVDEAVESVATELAAFFRYHMDRRQLLNFLSGPCLLNEIKQRLKLRYQTDRAFRCECLKSKSGQRYVTGFVRTWIADAIRTRYPDIHQMLPVDFRATGLPIAQGRHAPVRSGMHIAVQSTTTS